MNSSKYKREKLEKLAKQNQQPYTKTRRNQNKYEPRAFNQRAIVITKYTKRTELITKHIRYLERDEAHEGIQNKMKLHNATKIKRTIPGEEKYFKIILSPEQGNKMDMDQYVKRFISRIELSLNKEITAYWTVHNNTAKTHAHIIIRGVNENREVITIPKDIITKGMREIAETEATRQLGPRTKQDIEKQLEHELKETRLTTHDRKIIKMAINNSVTTTNTWIIKRLAYLEHMNLAKQTENLTWKIDENLEQKLRKLNKTLDIQKTLQKHNARTLYIPKSYSYTHGKVVETGFIDEMSDTEYVLVKTKKDLLAKIIIRETTAKEFKIGDEIVYRNGKLKHYEETEEHRQQQELMDAIREKIGYTKFKFYKNEDISGYVIHTIQTEDREGIIIRTDDDKIVYMETTEQIEDNGQITIQNGKIITEGIGQQNNKKIMAQNTTPISWTRIIAITLACWATTHGILLRIGSTVGVKLYHPFKIFEWIYRYNIPTKWLIEASILFLIVLIPAIYISSHLNIFKVKKQNLTSTEARNGWTKQR